jgi:LmbE family N-acetylglucosaminyl deacetylase
MRQGSTRRVVVLSPHIDDGIFSLGGSIARATRRRTHVQVVTIFANDPASTRASSPWDADCGFRTEGEASSARRDEDRRAADAVGAEALWLPLPDEEYREARDEELDEEALWSHLAPIVAGADAVVGPGFPLYHPDHAVVTRLAATHAVGARLGLYVEQPYASWRLIGRGRRTWTLPGLTFRGSLANVARIVARTAEGRRLQQPALPSELMTIVGGAPKWHRARAGGRAWVAKQRAVQAYASQLRGFGPLVGTRMALYELAWGGEGLAWIDG